MAHEDAGQRQYAIDIADQEIDAVVLLHHEGDREQTQIQQDADDDLRYVAIARSSSAQTARRSRIVVEIVILFFGPRRGVDDGGRGRSSSSSSWLLLPRFHGWSSSSRGILAPILGLRS